MKKDDSGLIETKESGANEGRCAETKGWRFWLQVAIGSVIVFAVAMFFAVPLLFFLPETAKSTPAVEFKNLPKAGKVRLEFVDDQANGNNTRDYICRPMSEEEHE